MKVLVLNVALLSLSVLDFLWLIVTVPVSFLELALRHAIEWLEVARLRAEAVAKQQALDQQLRKQAKADAERRAGRRTVHPWWGD